MHEEILPTGSQSVLEALERIPIPETKGWTLAGGTGLALLLGHRTSEDFDFFRTDMVSLPALHKALQGLTPCQTLQNEERTLTVIVQGVKLSFFIIRDPFIFPATPWRSFSVADVRDIALMKIVAISGRGSGKDFVDLYQILLNAPGLADYLAMFPRKYGEGAGNMYHILKSLTYFTDAEAEPLPSMRIPFDWIECKRFILDAARNSAFKI
ncbi:MAG: nucleotidyl transferase AbiEii/AbiGii toxin family protein [Candidatus Sumerlaeota bacterium]|nr:nucleotidyl transferase AbiEii/AbiGii toxin family protein [Candidatus Sumerlaeota bacterium]